MINLIFYFCLLGVAPVTEPYQARYKLSYSPDSTNLKLIGSETFVLNIKPGEASYFSTVNVLKKDSINILIKEGKMTFFDVMANPGKLLFKTRFPYFIVKEYTKQEVTVYEDLGADFNCKYPAENSLVWHIENQQDTVSGYLCTKATTQYCGRTYEAWFAPEIPFSDGPYIFKGLPGLIVKLSDTRNHYVYTLEQFGKYSGKVTEMLTYRRNPPVSQTHQQVFKMRELYRTDPLEASAMYRGIDMRNLKVSSNGGPYKPMRESLPDRSWDNNPLELKEK
ncbi:MAG: GLPGLI family protein [Siphonobacter sp.]